MRTSEKMRPKVLTLFPRAVGGGAERLVLDQMRFHENAGYDYLAVALRRGKLHEEFAAYSCYRCVQAGVRFNPWAVARLHRLLRAERIDVLHTHLQEADFYGYWLKRLNPGLVWISTRHNADDFRERWFWRTVNATITGLSQRVVAVSNSVREFVARHERIPAEKLIVIRNGIDVTRFTALPSRDVARAGLGVSPDEFVVGIVGRLAPQKGHKFLLEAAARLAPDIPKLRIVVVGEGQLKGRLERQARALGITDRVSFVGFRTDMAKVYPALDVLAVPSLFEGLSLVLVEALVCGRLAVCARASGIIDVVEDGKNGILIEIGDVEALAGALGRAYRGEVDPEMPRRAQQAARADFSLETYLARLERLYLDETAARRDKVEGPS
jgi:glycosyltransferase involved in cell wall biosynthesis